MIHCMEICRVRTPFDYVLTVVIFQTIFRSLVAIAPPSILN